MGEVFVLLMFVDFPLSSDDLMGCHRIEPQVEFVCFLEKLDVNGGVDPVGVDPMIFLSDKLAQHCPLDEPEELSFLVPRHFLDVEEYDVFVFPVKFLVGEQVNRSINEAVFVLNGFQGYGKSLCRLDKCGQFRNTFDA